MQESGHHASYISYSYVKFHCELNSIEMVCGAANHYTPDHLVIILFQELKNNIPALDFQSVMIDTIRSEVFQNVPWICALEMENRC